MFNRVLLAAACGFAIAASSFAATVTKRAASFEGSAWRVDQWAKARGETKLVADVAPGAPGSKSLATKVAFAGNGFQWFSIVPPSPLVIPGDLKTVTLRVKTTDPRVGMTLNFRDGWDRDKDGKKKLELPIKLGAANEWTTARFDVPDGWVKPVRIAAVGMHNWNFKNEKRELTFWLDDITVTTDVSGVDPDTGVLKTWRPRPGEKDKKKRTPPVTPLLDASITMPAEYNVFSRARPSARVVVRSWKSGTLSGVVRCDVKDDAGARVASVRRDVSIESAAELDVPLDVKLYGRYALTASLSFQGEKPVSKSMHFAWLPPWPQLTREQKLASPYGINVHSGKTEARYVPFRDAGIVWFRDYAWNMEWMKRAKGGDKKYAGWPFYPTIWKRITDAGVMVLPCLMKGIKLPKEGGPSAAWARDLADILCAFPEVTHWELDNEYDLHKESKQQEIPIDWANYRAYHRRFGEVLRAIGGGELTAVENGRAGIWPERARKCVESGDFANIGVLNTHHYCGIDPPETNFGNFNTGFEALERDKAPALFLDRMRATVNSGAADGRRREVWLTEFGWDTLAGHVVTPYQQAAYLPRAWMVIIAAGYDKAFWYWDFDSATPNNFFDGCGLMGPTFEPKLALCSLAGLTSTLPTPRYVGAINAGEGTQGYVFDQDGENVAALWSVKDDDGPRVSFLAGSLRDYLGNPLPGRAAKLRLAPTYVVGLTGADPFYLQTAYDLASPYLVVASAGDEVTATLRVRNNRTSRLRGDVKLVLPDGWNAVEGARDFRVLSGDRALVELSFRVDSGEALGERLVKLVVSERRGVIKEIPLRVIVQDPLIMRVGSIFGRPGKAEIKVKIGNRSSKAVDGALRLDVPASWKAHTPRVAVGNLKQGEIREVDVSFDWTDTWGADEKAMCVFTADGKSVTRPIIPQAYRIHRERGITIDGSLDDWDSKYRLPGWMLGTSIGEANAEVYLAWSERGLTGAVKVGDSRLIAADPRSFWNGDCMEIFVDTTDRKTHRGYEFGDHQFWLVPQVDEGRVYVGRWKRAKEIAKTQYDIEGVASAAKRSGDGYVMEFVIPASALQKYAPRAGGRIGLNLNITVKGSRYAREVFWPRTKADWPTANWPKMWASMQLVE